MDLFLNLIEGSYSGIMNKNAQFVLTQLVLKYLDDEPEQMSVARIVQKKYYVYNSEGTTLHTRIIRSDLIQISNHEAIQFDKLDCLEVYADEQELRSRDLFEESWFNTLIANSQEFIQEVPARFSS